MAISRANCTLRNMCGIQKMHNIWTLWNNLILWNNSILQNNLILRKTRFSGIQRFSELSENCRISSHQILTGKIDRSETAVEIMNHQQHKRADIYWYRNRYCYMNFNDHISTVSNLSVLMSKFDVMRPCNFHKVLKTSVLGFCRRPDLTEYCPISSFIIICMWSVYSISLKPWVNRKELKY